MLQGGAAGPGPPAERVGAAGSGAGAGGSGGPVGSRDRPGGGGVLQSCVPADARGAGGPHLVRRPVGPRARQNLGAVRWPPGGRQGCSNGVPVASSKDSSRSAQSFCLARATPVRCTRNSEPLLRTSNVRNPRTFGPGSARSRNRRRAAGAWRPTWSYRLPRWSRAGINSCRRRLPGGDHAHCKPPGGFRLDEAERARPLSSHQRHCPSILVLGGPRPKH